MLTLIKRDEAEVVLVGFVLAGRIEIVQGAHETILEPGAIALSDSTRPFRTRRDTGTDVGWLAVPKKLLSCRVPSLEDLTAVRFGSSQPVQPIVFRFLASLLEVFDDDHALDHADFLLGQARDLLVLMLEGRPSAEHGPGLQ